MKRCVIFGGGQIGDPEQIKNLVRQEDYLICADSGYRHCVQLGFSPQLVLGDFDSYAGVVQSDCELLRYPIEKDDTDTMLAVKQALQRGYERLVLVGMLGGRLDHTLANIQTLVYAVEHGAAAQIIDSSCCITVIKGGQTAQIPYQQGFHFSVFCHSDCASGVCIRHAKYELEAAQITNGFPIGVRLAPSPSQSPSVTALPKGEPLAWRESFRQSRKLCRWERSPGGSCRAATEGFQIGGAGKNG